MDEVVEINVTTGVETRRPLTTEEQAQRELDKALWAQQRNVLEIAQANSDIITNRLDQALEALQAHVNRGTFTNVQRDAALMLVLRVCIGLVRYVRKNFNGTD